MESVRKLFSETKKSTWGIVAGVGLGVVAAAIGVHFYRKGVREEEERVRVSELIRNHFSESKVEILEYLNKRYPEVGPLKLAGAYTKFLALLVDKEQGHVDRDAFFDLCRSELHIEHKTNSLEYLYLFWDLDDDKSLDFLELVDCCALLASKSAYVHTKLLRRLWRVLDMDGDCTVDRDELLHTLPLFFPTLSQEGLEKLVADIFAGADGDAEETGNVLQRQKRSLGITQSQFVTQFSSSDFSLNTRESVNAQIAAFFLQ